MKLIVNADDFGKTHSINLAIAECFKKGYISNTSIMVNMPFSDEAAEIARKEGFFEKVGLHINLTQGRQISRRVTSRRLANGQMLTGEFDKSLKGRLFLAKEERAQLYAEMESQIKKYLKYGFNEYHMDSHCHVHTGLSVFPAYRVLFKKYGFKSMRLSRNLGSDHTKLSIKIYKEMINRSIRNISEYTADYFGGFSDFAVMNSRKKADDNMVIEIMCHPDMNEKGKIENLYAGSGFEKDLVPFFMKNMSGYELAAYSDLDHGADKLKG